MPLQKSHSELTGTGTGKNRSPWQRSYSHPVNLQAPRQRPLQPVSQTTKNKLNRFQYAPPDDDAAEKPETPDGDQLVNPDVASTPVSRLTWQDILEPAVNKEDKDSERVSPNERLLWDTRQRTLYNQNPSPMMQRAGKKRARSSSPTSSPADKPDRPVVNVKSLANAFKSPHADPTLELWDRYSLRNANHQSSPTRLQNPALAHLMVSSSPRPPPKDVDEQAGGRNPGFRRSASHGLIWPKRRKVEKQKGGSQSSEGQRELEAASKSSLVTALLDSVQGETRKKGHEDLGSNIVPSPSKTNGTGGAILAADSQRTEPAPIIHISSSDYGDDDFDDDTMMELEVAMALTQGEKQVVAPSHQRSPLRQKAEIKGKALSPLDDFDDLGEDIFDGAEDLLAPTRADSKQPTLHSPRNKGTKPALAEFDDDFDDDFGGDIDFDAVELAATQSIKPAQQAPFSNSQKPRTIQRYLVTGDLDGEFIDQYGVHRPEKILVIQADGSKTTRTILLRGAWYDTPAHSGAYVHVIGDFNTKGQCVVDDAQNLIILHPDQLISNTVVSDSFGCMRRAVLQDRVKATSEPTPPLVYGKLLHEVFQDALFANRWDLKFLSQSIDSICEKHVEDLYTIKVGIPAAREHMQSKMTELSCWAKAFVSAEPKNGASVDDRNGKKATMAITKLLDVEEHVWSPMYGLKGNVDATVEVTMKDGQQSRRLTVPFEIKTGKHANSSHVAQTALYTLLLSDRYDIEIAYGILYYMETSKTIRVPAVRHELRHMILQRNQLACHVRERSVQLPPMLKSKHMCGRCYAKTSCFVYHRLADNGDGESSGLNEKFEELVRHLTPKHQEFFLKWEDLLTKEEKQGRQMKRELWTMTSAEREKKSRCFSDVIIEEGSASVDTNNPRINRYHYTFIKRNCSPGFSFVESEIGVGEPIVISDEAGHYALAIGYVTAVRKQRITVAVDRRLHNARIRQPGFDETDNQIFAGIMNVAQDGTTQDGAKDKESTSPIRYRIDQDEFSNGMATVRNNIVQMMSDEFAENRKIRELIVDLTAPRFKSVPTQYTLAGSQDLNIDQRQAIEKVMSAQDYALVLGMPGTGKTTTIAHIIRALVSQGKSVLLTSHTHTAVDNILLKLKSDKIPILRLGAPTKVHWEVQEFATLAAQPMATFDEIKEAWHGTPIVATTCLGINHPIFHERSFDYCIVDEASQITLPICAGPIRLARTFVLVGDHNQLPPVVKNEEAREGGLDVSLFKLLSDAHPESVTNLAHQYRMCEDIMTLSNTLIYDGKLRCGTESLRQTKLHIPNMDALRQKHYDATTLTHAATLRSVCIGQRQSRCWLSDTLDSEARVRFIDTDTVRPMIREEAHGKRIVNTSEVTIVSHLVESLLAVGVPAEDIGVMTHYRAQLSLLKERLRPHAGVEMHTTDRFQGRDKDVVVLSLVRSNDSCNIGDLLKDWRRINVAFTRAKTKLLVVGSMATLKNSGDENMLSKFIALMEQRDWIYHLPQDALADHYFEEMGTQLTAMSAQKKTPRKATGARARISPSGKENRRPSPKKAQIGERALLKGKPIMRDILNEMTNGAY